MRGFPLCNFVSFVVNVLLGRFPAQNRFPRGGGFI